MKNIVVLGSGMVGSAMAVDMKMSGNCRVIVADIDQKALNTLHAKHPEIQVQVSDLSDPDALQQIIADADLVIGAVPGYMGFETMKRVIQAGKDIVDIAFFDEDPFALNDLAKAHNVTAVMDCGVAPGMSNMILGYHNAHMDIHNFECLVGGLPFRRTWPYEYKAPFSPIDVIEEYTRPARIVENSNVVVRPALSEPEFVEFDTIGTLEAFNTDGLRTLLKTMQIPNMKEKTMRYPGHIEYVQILRETGYLSKEPVELNGVMVRPLDLTAKLLFPKWRLDPDEEEFTVMRIEITGQEKGHVKTYAYALFDRYDQETQTSSMARTTGYACTAVAQLVLNGEFNVKGIHPPEFIGAHPGCLQKVLDYMESRNIIYHQEIFES